MDLLPRCKIQGETIGSWMTTLTHPVQDDKEEVATIFSFLDCRARCTFLFWITPTFQYEKMIGICSLNPEGYCTFGSLYRSSAYSCWELLGCPLPPPWGSDHCTRIPCGFHFQSHNCCSVLNSINVFHHQIIIPTRLCVVSWILLPTRFFSNTISFLFFFLLSQLLDEF